MPLQEFNIEKLQLLENEKSKVKKDYERREGQIEVKKKMWVTCCPGAPQEHILLSMWFE